MDNCYKGILTRANIRKGLYLGVKPIAGTLEDPDEGYGPNCTGAPRFPIMESIYEYMLL